jgi:hypothetical protein
MKTPLLTLLFTGVISYSFSQSNLLPSSGNVGIGTTSPTERLTVNGSARIDSTLTVRDSMVVDRGAHIGSDLQVDGNITLDGSLKLNALRDSTLEEDAVLLIDENGTVKSAGSSLRNLVYSDSEFIPCKDENGGNTTPASPVWLNGPGKLYTSHHCVPDVRVGIGQNNPSSKLHITTALDKNTHPLIIDKNIQGSPTPYKLLELDNNGLLYAREIKVNLDAWPDYVFDANYPLMPLSELQAFIRKNNHLPNVSSACEMEESGINLAKSNVMLMEKVEELTLYMLQLKEQLDTQKQLLQQQQELINKLQEQVKP